MCLNMCQYTSTHVLQNMWHAYAETARMSVKQSLKLIITEIPAVWQLPWWGHQTLIISWLPNSGSSDCMLLCVQMFFILIKLPQVPHWPRNTKAKILQVIFPLLLNATVCSNLTEINQIHKYHNALIRYPTIHHSEQKCVHGTGWDMGQVHRGICE